MILKSLFLLQEYEPIYLANYQMKQFNSKEPLGHRGILVPQTIWSNTRQQTPNIIILVYKSMIFSACSVRFTRRFITKLCVMTEIIHKKTYFAIGDSLRFVIGHGLRFATDDFWLIIFYSTMYMPAICNDTTTFVFRKRQKVLRRRYGRNAV